MKKATSTKTLLAIAIGAAISQVSAEPTVRIIGGEDSKLGAYPWVVSLQSKEGEHFCGASLIAKQWVLTAAHCVEQEQAGNVQASVGEFDLNGSADKEQKIAVSRIIIHPNRDEGGEDNDIALIQLASPASKSPVNTATPAVMQGISVGTNLVVMGWGNTSTTGENFPNTLLEVQVPLVSNEQCSTNYGAESITENMICAGLAEGGKDSCQGDSGGPLLYQQNGQWQQVGVVSFGQGCAQPGYPGVYARVEKFDDWINGYVKGEVPTTPQVPETPEEPETPVTPEVPQTPEEPEVPVTPETPEVPENPEVSADSFNLPESIDLFAFDGEEDLVYLTLENTTDSSLTIADIDVTGAGFSVAVGDCQKTLTPGASCDLELNYNPSGEESSQGAMDITLADATTISVTLSGENLVEIDWDDDFAWFSDESNWMEDDGGFSMYCDYLGDDEATMLSTEIEGPGDFSFDFMLPFDADENELTYYVDGKRVRAITGARKKVATHATKLTAGKHRISWVYKKHTSSNGQIKISNIKFKKDVPVVASTPVPTAETTAASPATASVVSPTSGGGSFSWQWLSGLILLLGLRRLFGRR